jgi:hypothetical protein
MSREPGPPDRPPLSRSAILRRVWLGVVVTTIVYLISLGISMKYCPGLRGSRTASVLMGIGACLFILQTVLSFASRKARK